MHPEPDPRTYIPAATRVRIGSQLAAIKEAYPYLCGFMEALRDVPGTHGIRDIHVASDSISLREQGPAIVNLKVIVETALGIDQSDARSRVTDALEGYGEDGRRIVYEFTTFENRPAGALASVVEARTRPTRIRETDDLIDRLRAIYS
jgi:hypothetical protein